jgi:glycosyltransferase involved in cell wall biosynthesis
MRLLFVHQNFPGQFKHLAPALVKQGHQVLALRWGQAASSQWQGLQQHCYQASRRSTPNIHPWVADFETKVIRAEACLKAARGLAATGFSPDAIIAHPGWGESLFLKDVWPHTRLGIYCEFHYAARGADVGFDPEFPGQDPTIADCQMRLKNLNNQMHFQIADAGLSPTHWQASSFPEPFRQKISIIHDGIDTTLLKPNPQASLDLSSPTNGTLQITKQHEVITFVNRNLEPYRGYHIFMRALPAILKRRPDAHVLLVGGDGVSYGSKPNPEKYGVKSWRDIFVEEVRPAIAEADWQRVHFLGHIPYAVYLQLLQLSTVHVYLTYPFVLSWSLLEAMSIGCAIVASDTAPVQEAIEDGRTGRLVDFFDHQALSSSICELLNDPDTRTRFGHAARDFAIAHYDLQSHCLPKQLDWVAQLGK